MTCSPVGGCSKKKGCGKCWYSIRSGGSGGNIHDRIDRPGMASVVASHGASGGLGFMMACRS
jgi:hypothetical protein